MRTKEEIDAQIIRLVCLISYCRAAEQLAGANASKSVTWQARRRKLSQKLDALQWVAGAGDVLLVGDEAFEYAKELENDLSMIGQMF